MLHKMLITLLLCSFYQTTFASVQAWTLVSDKSSNAEYPCSNKLETQISATELAVVNKVSDNSLPLDLLFNRLNKGRKCWQKPAETIFRGMYCEVTTLKNNVYKSVSCETNIGAIKCRPNEKKKDHDVYKVKLDGQTLHYTSKRLDPESDEDVLEINDCTYTSVAP